MLSLSEIYLYRMTHIENIPHILKNGITHSNSQNANQNYISIGDSTLISTRNKFKLKNGKLLGNYIPFYFGVRTSMLYVVQKGYNTVKPTLPEDIVYCVSSIQKIIDQQLNFVFTDGHAVDSFSSQYTATEVNNIEKLLDFESIKAKYWVDENDLDRKRRKEAEFLVEGNIGKDAILGYITYNKTAKNKLVEFGALDTEVYFKSTYYF